MSKIRACAAQYGIVHSHESALSLYQPVTGKLCEERQVSVKIGLVAKDIANVEGRTETSSTGCRQTFLPT